MGFVFLKFIKERWLESCLRNEWRMRRLCSSSKWEFHVCSEQSSLMSARRKQNDMQSVNRTKANKFVWSKVQASFFLFIFHLLFSSLFAYYFSVWWALTKIHSHISWEDGRKSTDCSHMTTCSLPPLALPLLLPAPLGHYSFKVLVVDLDRSKRKGRASYSVAPCLSL